MCLQLIGLSDFLTDSLLKVVFQLLASGFQSFLLCKGRKEGSLLICKAFHHEGLLHRHLSLSLSLSLSAVMLTAGDSAVSAKQCCHSEQTCRTPACTLKPTATTAKAQHCCILDHLMRLMLENASNIHMHLQGEPEMGGKYCNAIVLANCECVYWLLKSRGRCLLQYHSCSTDYGASDLMPSSL